jgi:ABC-2 type transport system ATP-binding protein
VADAREEVGEPAIVLVGLSRTFGPVKALDSVDLTIPRGAVFGLLGPNGAGKTTTVRILNGVLDPTSVVRLEVLGHDLRREAEAVRPQVGVQTDTNLYERLSAYENLAVFGRLYGMDAASIRARVGELLEMFDLTDRARERVERLSKGMKQKLLIARALIARPRLVYLDEPTAGIDPEASHELMTYITRVSREANTTFFITSHRLEEMEGVCTDVAVLAGGRIRAAGSPEQVARAAVPRVRVRVTPVPGSALTADDLVGLPGVATVAASNGGFAADLVDEAAVPVFLRAATALPFDLMGVAEERPTLQEAYLALVGSQRAPADRGVV